MNIYRHRFSATCPANGRIVEYALEIRAHRMILAEDVVKACGQVKRAYHEQIAETLYNKLGGFQVLTAHRGHRNTEGHRMAVSRQKTFDEALDEAFLIIIRDRLRRCREQLLANVKRIEDRKRAREEGT